MGGDTGPAIVPGDADGSLLVDAVRYGQSYQMPPTGKLPENEIAALISWVKAGAPWPGTAFSSLVASRAQRQLTDEDRSFWAFRPARDPIPPSVKQDTWPCSPIDRFILAAQEKAGLAPAPPADRRTLIRRATFDLIGLPPTPEEVNDFLEDDSTDAFARVIDRLLASPRYGERWGRHWLDVARYADSNGMDENLAYANAFRYRDYVIAAFNADKPYDEFVREQIAGDLLPADSEADSLENRIATGFLVIGPKMLAEDDPVKMEMDIIDEQVDTIGQAFLGITLGCARCHDHKFDPISMEDYYALAGIFKSTKTMEHFRVVARWQEQPVASAESTAQLASAQHNLAAQRAELNTAIATANEALIEKLRTHLADYLLAAYELEHNQQVLAALRTPAPDQGKSTQAIVIEAENFLRGNVLSDFTAYGNGIGVIYNKGELPNFAEYQWQLPTDQLGQIELRYAAAEARPVRLTLNGQVIAEAAAAQQAGSWKPDGQRWEIVGVFHMRAGNNVLRLERDGPIPHFDKIVVLPRLDLASPNEFATPEQIAAGRTLDASHLVQFAAGLKAAKPGSVFELWKEAVGVALRSTDRHASTVPISEAGSNRLAETPIAHQPATATRLGRLLSVGPRPAPLQALADRYQQLFTAAHSSLRLLNSGAASLCESLASASLQTFLHALLPTEAERCYPAEAAAQIRELRAAVAQLESQMPFLPQAMVVSDQKPQNLRIHIRGSHWTLGDEVPRRFPTILAGESQPPIPANGSGRLELARWLTAADNSLTARVMVNRIWTWHFGAGLVPSPDNFGRLGQAPTHPELLDWLARRFIESGWSIKAMHRLIMLTNTYQMGTRYSAAAAAADPDDRLYWRARRRRLDAEQLHDAILAVSGRLDLTMGGSLLQTANRAYVAATDSVNRTNYETPRRAIYLPVIRSAVYEMFQAFDFADPSVLVGQRNTTTVAPQALFMLNSSFVADEARHLAESLLSLSVSDDAARVRLLYEKLLSRPPNDDQARQALDFLESATEAWQKHASAQARLRAWQSLCRALMSANEFIYVE